MSTGQPTSRTVRRTLEITGPQEAVERQLRCSLRDGQHTLGACGVSLEVKTVYSEVDTIADVNLFDRPFDYEKTQPPEPPLDLDRDDIYAEYEVPNADFMMALKVLRTARKVCNQEDRNDEASTLFRACRILHRLARDAMKEDSNGQG